MSGEKRKKGMGFKDPLFSGRKQRSKQGDVSQEGKQTRKLEHPAFPLRAEEYRGKEGDF